MVENPNLNPAEVYNFHAKIVVEKDENKQKRGQSWPIKKVLKIKVFIIFVQKLCLNHIKA